MEVGTTSTPLQVQAANATGIAVPISSVAITAPFALASNSCGTVSLIANTSCQLMVVFQPTQATAASGLLTLTDGAGTQTVTLNGTGAAPPTDQLNPTSVAFPATATGQLSALQPVLLTNTGDLPLTSITIAMSGAFQSSGTCGTQLSGHSACTISVTFAPLQLGAQTGVLTVSDALRTQTVALTGTAVQPATLAANPASLSFGNENVGVASAPLTVTISNKGGVAAANVGFQISGAAASSFATGTNLCSPALTAGASCSVQVIFTPAAAGSSTAALTISSSTLGVTPIVLPLNGAGQAVSGLNASPAELTFSTTVAGTASAAQTVTVSNTSGVAAAPLSLSVSGVFSLAQNACAPSLAAGASCTVGIIFAPIASGPATGTLTVSSATIANTALVPLNGAGAVPAGIQITPSSLSFPITGVGQTSSPAAISVTNTGSLDTLNNLVLSVPAGFQLSTNNCATTLAPGASCTAAVAFAPTSAGAQTRNLTVTTSTLANGVSVPLQGTGFDFRVTISGSSTHSVTSGASASFSLVLTPLSGTSGTFTLACNALPANALCSFSPASESLTAGATGNVVVQISTGSSNSASRARRPGFWSTLPLMCGLALFRRRRKLRRIWHDRLLVLALLGLLFVGLASCTTSGGGGGGGSGKGPGSGGLTPTGTYSVPVTVTSTGVAHSATVTLTVD